MKTANTRISMHSTRYGYRRVTMILGATLLAASAAYLLPLLSENDAAKQVSPRRAVKVLKPSESAAVLGATKVASGSGIRHPQHTVKVWTARHKGRTFRITQLPHCEHLETLITYDPSGETLKQAKQRTNGVVACTGSFHNSRSMALADFLQRGGRVLSPARTGRGYMAVYANGTLDISCDYKLVKGKSGISALALGQRLLPLQTDGFSKAFMNKKTDRIAVALNRRYVFIVQGSSDIWRLAHFIEHKLPARSAINCDGGHVVRGKGPVHIVFRWKDAGSIARIAMEKEDRQICAE